MSVVITIYEIFLLPVDLFIPVARPIQLELPQFKTTESRIQ